MKKYEAIAEYVIAKYPFSAFFDEKQIDYDNFAIKNGVGIGAFFVGFGEKNKSFFLSSVKNNCFVSVSGGIEEKHADYFVFGKDERKFVEFYDEVFRYDKEEFEKSGEYSFLPDDACKTSFFETKKFDEEFRKVLSEKLYKGEKDKNFVFIDSGSKEKDEKTLAVLLSDCEKRKIGNVVFFISGEEKECVEGAKNNVVVRLKKVPPEFENEKEKFAVLRNACYDIQYAFANGKRDTCDEKEVFEKARKSFENKSEIDKESSVYGCLAMRSKLAFLGLDFVKGKQGISEREFFEIYAKGDEIKFADCGKKYCGKRIIDYDCRFSTGTIRFYAAVQEHVRWNAFYLANGYVPAKTKDILSETVERGGKKVFTNGKNVEEKRHGNLSSFSGLKDFARKVARRDGVGENERDVIKYDYQILDDAYFILSSLGYGIVKKSRLSQKNGREE